MTGEQLREARKDAGLTQKELAELLDLDPRDISSVERDIPFAGDDAVINALEDHFGRPEPVPQQDSPRSKQPQQANPDNDLETVPSSLFHLGFPIRRARNKRP
jgi:transcriptional regulator with XRE-family HTH domain